MWQIQAAAQIPRPARPIPSPARKPITARAKQAGQQPKIPPDALFERLSGIILELLSRFELLTSSLPRLNVIAIIDAVSFLL